MQVVFRVNLPVGAIVLPQPQLGIGAIGEMKKDAIPLHQPACAAAGGLHRVHAPAAGEQRLFRIMREKAQYRCGVWVSRVSHPNVQLFHVHYLSFQKKQSGSKFSFTVGLLQFCFSLLFIQLKVIDSF